jgi:TatD DNase family protein
MIDLHSHLDLYPNPRAVRDECERRSIRVLSVTTTPSAWNGTRALASESGCIRTALGLHPQLAHERQNELALFDRLLRDTSFVGEIGLDGGPEYRRHGKIQLAVLEHILGKCREAGGRLLSLHSRSAAGPVLNCLEAFSGAGTPILHWFSGSLRDLDRAIDLGCWFSVGPAMLAGERGRALAARMPRERVLTESDGPFAEINRAPLMPWDVDAALRRLSEIWSVPLADAQQTIDTNLRRLLADPRWSANAWMGLVQRCSKSNK